MRRGEEVAMKKNQSARITFAILLAFGSTKSMASDIYVAGPYSLRQLQTHCAVDSFDSNDPIGPYLAYNVGTCQGYLDSLLERYFADTDPTKTICSVQGAKALLKTELRKVPEQPTEIADHSAQPWLRTKLTELCDKRL
jgi:hypothetical protein